MPLNINTSNYINNQMTGTTNGQSVVGSASISGSEGAIVSVKGLDLQAGQTLSGKIIEIDGKEVKLLLSNEQTINAKLEGNINALLGQTLSFEVKSSENGQTALRPLYTNLNNSQTVLNALQNAGLPNTEQNLKMVSAMMDEGMPINKNAIYDMSKQVNSFPNANPETVVQLNKLGLQVNELTLNQYENYKGLEHQIIGDVENISKGLSDLMRESIKPVAEQLNINTSEALSDVSNEAGQKPEGKNLLSAFLEALTGTAKSQNEADIKFSDTQNSNLQETGSGDSDIKGELSENIENEELALSENGAQSNKTPIDVAQFDISRQILNLIDNSDNTLSDGTKSIHISDGLKALSDEIKNMMNNELSTVNDKPDNANVGKDSLLRTLVEETSVKETVNNDNVLDLAKNLLNQINENPERFSESLKSKLVELLSNKEFSGVLKDGLSKQMLLKPEEVVNAKNVDELYQKIVKQANQAIEILNNSSLDSKGLLESANNIKENVTFMNELNQVVTYVQLPLLMNNKSAHGDLYVYTNKKSLKNNDGNISALLHLDMENLGPMDIYVALTNSTKLNTHFYLQDEATIDFIEKHIDALNDRLTKKGYNVGVDISVKDSTKGSTNIAKEFMKDDPGQEGVSASKFSFDVRA